MEATLAVLDASQAQDSTRYKSRPGALAWFFRKSRDRWKEKHQELKAILKRYKNRVADVTKSREQWRLKAEIADKRVAALEAENVELRTRLSVLEPEKKRQPQPSCASPFRWGSGLPPQRTAFGLETSRRTSSPESSKVS